MTATYDVIVIGGGASGENAASRVAAGGLSAALVEKQLLGGECSYWACMPSKAMLRPGELLSKARRVPGVAPAVTGDIDIDATLRSRDDIISHLDDGPQMEWAEDAGIEVMRGVARLAGERRIEMERDGGTENLEAREAVVIATGSRAAMPPVDGLAEAGVWDNRDATTVKDVPERLLVLGGGVVGVEMAQVFRSFGAEVTLVEVGDRLLMVEEPFAGEEIAEALRASGIDVRTGATATSVERDGGGQIVMTLDDGQQLAAEELLVATGRTPVTDDLGLEHVGLEPGSYIDVDDQLRATGVEGGWLYAVGDVNGRNLLTHMGKYQARQAADVILGKDVSAWAEASAAPRVSFTEPRVAAVGMTEQAARDAGLDVATVQVSTGGVAGSVVQGLAEPPGTSHLVIDTRRNVVVGATFTGSATGELLHSATIAIVGEVPLDRLWHAVPAFPTVSEVWLRLLERYGL